jgi:small GTP-binding protein
MNKEVATSFKLVLLGDAGVGKTSIMQTYFERTFDENQQTTISIELRKKLLDLDDKKVQIELWDTAGQERFRSVASFYYKNASGILLVYDITSETSLDIVKFWIQEIKSNAELDCLIYIVGNKTDLESERKIRKQDVDNLAKQEDLKHFEITAKIPEKIDDVIMAMVDQLILKQSVRPISSKTIVLKPEKAVISRPKKNSDAAHPKKGSACCN